MENHETFELEFGTFKKYERYILGLPKADSNMGIPEAREINRLIGTQYTENYGYIGDRINANSSDPTVYLLANKENPLLKSIALVVYSEPSRKVAELEQQAAQTSGLNFGIFNDVDSAVEWTLSELDKLERDDSD